MALPVYGPVSVSTGEEISGIPDLYDAYGRLIGHHYLVRGDRGRPQTSSFVNISLHDACATDFHGSATHYEMSHSQQGLDLVIFSFARSRQALCYLQRDAECIAEPGDIILHATDAPLLAQASRKGTVTAVALPRAKLFPLVANEDLLKPRVLPASNMALSLFIGHARNLLALGTTPDHRLAGLIGDQLCDLAALAIGTSATGCERVRKGQTLVDARYNKAMDFISRHMSDPALSEDEIARHLNLSTSSLRKIFSQKQTTVAKSIRKARVELAARLLADPRYVNSKVISIAFECGFHAPSAFYEAFRERYGGHPSDFRLAKRP